MDECAVFAHKIIITNQITTHSFACSRSCSMKSRCVYRWYWNIDANWKFKHHYPRSMWPMLLSLLPICFQYSDIQMQSIYLLCQSWHNADIFIKHFVYKYAILCEDKYYYDFSLRILSSHNWLAIFSLALPLVFCLFFLFQSTDEHEHRLCVRWRWNCLKPARVCVCFRHYESYDRAYYIDWMKCADGYISPIPLNKHYIYLLRFIRLFDPAQIHTQRTQLCAIW